MTAQPDCFSSPPWRGAVTDHFDGRTFHNLEPQPPRGVRELLRWQVRRHRGPWRAYTPAPPGPRPPRRVTGTRMRVTFVNHATLLVQQDGLNVLTDPIWSRRASPVPWAGPARVRPPGIRFGDLPPIDVVLVSHNHYDHLDLPTLRRLARRHDPLAITALGNGALLRRAGLRRVVELDWWQSHDLGGGRAIVAVPAAHFSQRGLRDRNTALWAGFVVRGPAGAAYFAGDTGWGGHFRAIGRRLGPLRLALLPIGAYRPRWFMRPMHISPEEAVQAQRDLGAATSVAMHFGTFPLGDDGEHEPVQALERARTLTAAPPPRFWVLGFGEGRDVPALPPR